MPDDYSESDYRSSVESIARDAYDDGKEGEDESDHIHESVDGSCWVIYTARAACVCRYSRNEGAAFDQMGSDALSGCTSLADVHTRLAYYAMRADVEECLAENRDAWDEESEDEDESDE